jgi:hypothetical protein
MLLDDIMPDYDVTEVHSIRIKASPDAVFQSLNEITITEISGIVRLLFFLRALPEKPEKRRLTQINNKKPFLSSMMEKGFTKLSEQKPREIVFGTIVPGDIGRFWKKSGSSNISQVDAEGFMVFNDPDYVQVVANFSIEEANRPGFVIVRTESRSKALSRQSLKKFIPYWRIIRPFSGLIRRLWLRAIKRRAEKQAVVSI